MKSPLLFLTTLLALVCPQAVSPSAADETADYCAECPPEDRRARAGCPDCIAPWARCTYGSKYCGQYIGGGATRHGKRSTCLWGEPRYCDEGTFGMDYAPWYSRVELRWYHGKRTQGGEGQYEQNHKVNPFVRLFQRHH
jgi:hypothetical protein